MMIVFASALVAVLQQGAAPARSQQQQPQRPSSVLRPSSGAPRTAFDSSVAALVDVGTKVAEVRSAYELYRRAVFNQPDGAILVRGDLYQNSCRALAVSVQKAQREICRTCMAPNIRPTIEQYRANLPSLTRMANACSARMARLRERGTAAAADGMRADIRLEGERLLNGLRPYEARLAEVRRVMGWAQQEVLPTPRRGN
jgi:hypothetical protein